MTGFYIVLGPSNTVSDMAFNSYHVDINFLDKYAVQRTTSPTSINQILTQSGFYNIGGPNGQIISKVRLDSIRQGDL